MTHMQIEFTTFGLDALKTAIDIAFRSQDPETITVAPRGELVFNYMSPDGRNQDTIILPICSAAKRSVILSGA